MNQNQEDKSRQGELQILAEMARRVGQNHKILPALELTGFMAMRGKNYSGELMVVGRAVNGWAKKTWTPESMNSDSNIQEFVNDVLRSVSAPESCPMSWVSSAWGKSTVFQASNWAYHGAQDYNSKKSAFWRVIRDVIGKFKVADINDDTWPSHLLWSNLYKISPSEGGNPSAKLRSIQRPTSIALLEKEIEQYKPRRLLFLAGYDWVAPFLDHLAPNVSKVRDSPYIHAVGSVDYVDRDKCCCVVAVHPQGKNEANWVRDVVKAFEIGNE